jgi:hypothetical protein
MVREILSDIVRDDQRAGEIILGLRNLLRDKVVSDLQPTYARPACGYYPYPPCY